MNMSDQSELSIRYHSLVFGVGSSEYNTWDSWHLIPSEPPAISPPEVKTKFVEIPGRNGQLDITDIGGQVRYDYRKGSWSFYIADHSMDREDLYNNLQSLFHGKIVKVYVLDDPYCYYEGRLAIENLNNAKDYSKIGIAYTLNAIAIYPDVINTPEGWLWDPFNFETHVIDMVSDPQRILNPSPIL